MEIRKARCREVYDIGVEDEPHLFALASGVLTHNSKPNPMPESVKDRPTSSYEHIFMLTKSQRYYWDADAVAELSEWNGKSGNKNYRADNGWCDEGMNTNGGSGHRNIRDVWTIATQPSGFRHHAAFPEEIPTRCIKAATKVGDLVLDPFCGTGRTLYAAQKLGRNAVGYDLSEKYCDMARQRCGLL